ncbi:polysaccharide pyruvyl transferase family protein [Brachybacterium fresconis]|uniref:Outer membrane murein-binding lipoprotein Lpp n=1 Tax=Brachybacterium fresconis TaxID=173363 RepID=A0ABS4YG18_9MICO|nr:outer membrane murein-binding lipoprotein Lpp [Brachybacterium fresconis]
MTKRYLMRLGKSPFDVADAFHTLDRNWLGTNSGNLIYGAASHKLFSTQDTVVEANHYRINGKMADQVNAEYDGFILPLANCFRPDFEDHLRRTADFLERLTIPFVMLSGGAQLPLDGDPSALRAMEPTITRFARAVLSGSSALTVRGEMTAEYLRSLGFHDVVVVGCPSLTLHGPGHRVEVPETLAPGAPIAYNLETKDPFGGDLIADAERHYRATYIAQEHGTLELMLWATSPYDADDPRLPLERSHPQFTAARAEMYIDAYPWIGRLEQMAFSFGARAHGNIAAVLAGTPSVMLAHDSRTLELAQHHGIPYLIRGSEHMPHSVQELYSQADFTEFNRGHLERFETLSSFLHENGFEHIYDPGQESARADYERRVAEMSFPPAVRPTWIGESPEATQRHAVLQDRDVRRKKTQAAIRREATNREKRTQEQLAQLSLRVEEVGQRLEQEQRRADAAEKRREAAEKHAAKAEARLTTLDERLRTITQQVGEANDRAQRAVRIPTRLKDALTRSPRER